MMEDFKSRLAEFGNRIKADAERAAIDPVRCPSCQDQGWEASPDKPDRLRRCESCDYWARKRGIADGVPDDEQGSLLENYKPSAGNADAQAQARLFLEGVHPNLYIWGGVGTGKTRLACSILNTVWKNANPPSTLFVRAPELLLKLQPGGDADADGPGPMFDRVTTVELLALDDIGASQGSDFARRTLQSIYDKRLDLGHRTVFTSNLDLDHLATFLADDRLASRIMGSAKVVRLDGKDWRTVQAKQKLVGADKSKAAADRQRERRTGAGDRRGGDPRLPTGDRD